MGHEIIYMLFICQAERCANKYVGQPRVEYHSLGECEKAATEMSGTDAPPEENGRHYYWVHDAQGRIVTRSELWLECKALIHNS
jgi:hypothetical protein